MPEKPTYEELEQKVKKLEGGALRESETQFRQLYDQMKDGLAIYGVIDGGKDFIAKRGFNTPPLAA